MANRGRGVPVQRTRALQAQQAAGVSKLAARVKVETFDCGIHDITYTALRPGCPICDAERKVREMQHAMTEMRNQLAVAVDNIAKLQVQVDIVHAIREAVSLLDDGDMSFLKTVLYMHRDEKSVALKVTHGSNVKRKKYEYIPPNGFIVIPRRGEPYGHVCTSVGGLAIAEYFEEAANVGGPAVAMQMLTRGMAQHLPGAIR